MTMARLSGPWSATMTAGVAAGGGGTWTSVTSTAWVWRAAPATAKLAVAWTG